MGFSLGSVKIQVGGRTEKNGIKIKQRAKMEGVKKAEEAFSLVAMMKSFFNVQEIIWKYNYMNMKEIRTDCQNKIPVNSFMIFLKYTLLIK